MYGIKREYYRNEMPCKQMEKYFGLWRVLYVPLNLVNFGPQTAEITLCISAYPSASYSGGFTSTLRWNVNELGNWQKDKYFKSK